MDSVRERTVERLKLKYGRTSNDLKWVYAWLAAALEEAWDAGQADERERCAKVAVELVCGCPDCYKDNELLYRVQAAIRSGKTGR